MLLLVACGGAPPAGSVRLSVSVSGAGTVSAASVNLDCGTSCTADVAPGTEVTLTARPERGQVLQGWGGACSGASRTSCTVTVQQATAVTATFAPEGAGVVLRVSVSGMGSIASQPSGIDCGSTCQATFSPNTSVTLTAVPAQGQAFSGWGGACAGAATSCTVVMAEARAVSATFEPGGARTLVRASVTGSGRITSQPSGLDCPSNCASAFSTSSTVAVTAVPSAGHAFAGWSGDCSGGAETCSLSLTQERSVIASFSPRSTAPSWAMAQLLETSDDFNVTESGAVSQVNAISPTGDAMVIWQQPDGQPNGSTSKVFSRLFLAGQGWQPAVQVPGLSDFSSRQLVAGRLFFSAQGVATWIRPGFDARRFTVAGGWTGPVTAAELSGKGAITGAVMDATGVINLVTTGSGVYTIALSATGQWGGWTRLDASGGLDVDAADLARSTNGTAIAIWAERNPGDSNDSMKAARFDPASGWQAPVPLETSFDDVDGNQPPRVAMDANGNALAVWKQGNSVRVNTFSPASGWAGAMAFDAGALSTTTSLRFRLAMAADGRAVLAWQSGIFAIKTMTWVPGTGFSTPLVAAPYGIDRELGIDDQGTASLVYVSVSQWPNPTSTELSVYARRLRWGEAWSEQTLVESRPGAIKTGVAVSFNRSGAALASWAQNDVTTSDARNSLWAALLP